MANVIAIANQKGGVGKTTTCVNLAAALSQLSAKVLLIDVDPQGNASTASGLQKNEVEHNLLHVLLQECSMDDAIQSGSSGYDVLASNDDLTAAEVHLLQDAEQKYRLLKSLADVQQRYDVVLLDCPPSLNMLTLNALVAANSVLIPMQCEYYALEGLTALINTIQQLQQTVNPTLTIEGILPTMFDSRNRLANDVLAQLKEHFGDLVYSVSIPRNIRLAEAPSHGLSGVTYDLQSLGAQAYIYTAKQLWKKYSVKSVKEEVIA